MADSDPKSVQDLSSYVQQVLDEMQGKFKTMSDGTVNRIEEMGNRIGDLEKSVAELLAEAGMDAAELLEENKAAAAAQ